jgi:hypothetical protein
VLYLIHHKPIYLKSRRLAGGFFYSDKTFKKI